MPMILHGIVGSSWEHASDQCPLVTIHGVSRNKALLLFLAKWSSVYPWVELIEPSEPTTLSCVCHVVDESHLNVKIHGQEVFSVVTHHIFSC